MLGELWQELSSIWPFSKTALILVLLVSLLSGMSALGTLFHAVANKVAPSQASQTGTGSTTAEDRPLTDKPAKPAPTPAAKTSQPVFAPDAATAVVEPPSAIPAARLPAKLRVLSVPWCQVEVDGRALGPSGQLHAFELTEGKHALRLVRGSQAVSRDVVIDGASETVVKVQFDAGIVHVGHEEK
jgi:hypothetical protein